jgi:hypothetical protein
MPGLFLCLECDAAVRWNCSRYATAGGYVSMILLVADKPFAQTPLRSIVCGLHCIERGLSLRRCVGKHFIYLSLLLGDIRLVLLSDDCVLLFIRLPMTRCGNLWEQLRESARPKAYSGIAAMKLLVLQSEALGGRNPSCECFGVGSEDRVIVRRLQPLLRYRLAIVESVSNCRRVALGLNHPLETDQKLRPSADTANAHELPRLQGMIR